MEKPQHPSFREALEFWFRLGWISFGGPAGQIAIMHEFLVDRRRWISESKFMHALNYCMLLPGPEAQQLATYSGWLLHGWRGGLAAGALFVLPSTFILLILSVLYVRFGTLPAVESVFQFLKPAVLAIVVGAVWKIGKKSLLTPAHWLTAAAAFAGIVFLKIPFPWIVVGALAFSWLATRFFPKTWTQNFSKNSKKEKSAAAADESDFVINQNSQVATAGFSLARLVRQVVVALILWAAGLLALWIFDPSGFDFWKKLVFFFSQAAFVTFGGAYAVLPYVAQVSVEKFGWLTSAQMLDGLALGETTPGPLIMVLAFVGFMAGFSAFGGSVVAGAVALLTTVFYTFLPSFVFIFAGAPLIERTQANPVLKNVLGFATAAVAGVVLSLAVYFGAAVLLPAPPALEWLPLVWLAVSLLALQKFGVGMIAWIGASAAAGLLRFLFF